MAFSPWSDATIMGGKGQRGPAAPPDTPRFFTPTCPECCGPLNVEWRPTPDGGRDLLICSVCRLEV